MALHTQLLISNAPIIADIQNYSNTTTNTVLLIVFSTNKANALNRRNTI